MEKDKYIGVLLEDVNSKFDLIIELVTPLPVAIAQLQDDMRIVKSDVAVIKRVVGDHSITLKNHEHRLQKLEAA